MLNQQNYLKIFAKQNTINEMNLTTYVADFKLLLKQLQRHGKIIEFPDCPWEEEFEIRTV